MSRIGRIPVSLPREVKAVISSSSIGIEGPKGKLNLTVPQGIQIEQKNGDLVVTRLSDTKEARSVHGTTRAHLAQMVVGVTKGHKKELEIQGVGFRVSLQGKKLVFGLGFSHPIEFEIPSEIKVSLPSQTLIIIEGADRASVGQLAAKMRSQKPVEPYKGKGIRYVGEHVRRKQGKSVTK